MTPPAETRLAPIPAAEWDDRTRTVLLSHLRRPELYLSGAPDAPPMPEVLELFAHHVPLGDTFMTFTDMLAGEDSQLDAADRELLILRVAWRTGSGYEWNQHRRLGGEVGLTEEQLEAVVDGSSAPVWSPAQRALLAAVDEFVDDFAVSDPTWDALSAVFEPAQLFELLFVIGGYLSLAGVLNSIGLRGGDVPARRGERQGDGS